MKLRPKMKKKKTMINNAHNIITVINQSKWREGTHLKKTRNGIVYKKEEKEKDDDAELHSKVI